MRAVVTYENELRLEEVPDPEPGEGEVLVHLEAAGVNHVDLARRVQGAPAGTILGVDGCGWVGAQERETRSQRVLVTDAPGTYAELVAVPEESVFSLPESVTDAVAAALGVPYRTAWWSLVDMGGLEQGARVLVQAGSSATGQAAIDVARAHECTIYATASRGKLDRVRALGAEALAYDDPRLEELEVDVAFDPVGRETFDRSLAALAHDGRLVTPGALGDRHATFDVWTLVRKRARLIGTGPAPLVRETMTRVIGLASHGRLTPAIDRELPLEQAAEAHRAIAARETFGKVILRP